MVVARWRHPPSGMPEQQPRVRRQPNQRVSQRSTVSNTTAIVNLLPARVYTVGTALDLAEYIDSFYNPVRRHSHLGGVSPNEFEAAHRKRKSGVY